jgi:hypothetical protein
MRLVLALLLATAVVASAQQNATPATPATPAAADTTSPAMTTPAAVYHLQVGPVLHIWGAAVNTVHAEGRKVNWGNQFIPYAGASILAPFGTKTKLGLKLDLAYSAQTMIIRPFERYPLLSSNVDWKGEITEQYGHFCIAPSLYFSGFTIGVGFNLPMSVKWSDENGNESIPGNVNGAWLPDMPPGSPGSQTWPTGYDFTQDMQMTMDIRIGGVIPVWETDMGALNVEVLGKYNFTGLWADGMYPYGTEVNAYGVPVTSNKEVVNVSPASFSVGISYLFDLKL